MAEEETSVDDQAEVEPPEEGMGAPIQPVTFGPLGADVGDPGDQKNLDLLLDVSIPVSVEVGSAQMPVGDILKLVPGSIVALDKKAEEPVDLRVNGKLIARGEVVMVDDTYGLRITQIVDPTGRIESLRTLEQSGTSHPRQSS